MPHAHAAEQALALADLCAQALTSSLSSPSARDTSETRPQFTVTPAEREAAISFIQANDIGQRPLVAFHPSAGEPLKSWPLARWAALADRLAGEGIDVLLSGGPADEPLLQDFARRLHHPPSAVLLGQPIGVAAAVYERCAVVVGPDNGPLHLAAAVGAPTVRLYGPAPIAVFGPWPPGPRQRTLVAPALGCVPCGRLVDPPCRSKVEPPCMLLISVEEVAENVLSLVRASASGLASAAPG